MGAKYTTEEMQQLSLMIVSYLDSWKIKDEDILLVLGFSKDTKKRLLQQIRKGSKGFPETEEIIRRIEHIIGITDALRTTFPFSEAMRVKWLHKAHRRFQKLSPLQVILSEGVKGLQRVRIDVDCSYGWAINDSLKKNQA